MQHTITDRIERIIMRAPFTQASLPTRTKEIIRQVMSEDFSLSPKGWHDIAVRAEEAMLTADCSAREAVEYALSERIPTFA